jgi:hypothetical protein
MRRLEWGSEGIEGEGRLLETVAGGSFGWRLKTTGKWGPHVSEGEATAAYRFGLKKNGPRAGFLLWAESFPWSPKHFYSVCFFSLFFSGFLFEF